MRLFYNEVLYGRGTIVPKCLSVHNTRVQEDEECLLLLRTGLLLDTEVHPLYNYPMEEQSFVQWKREWLSHVSSGCHFISQ